ncbi:unnamed protein product, partial [Pleuronectes platessa]
MERIRLEQETAEKESKEQEEKERVEKEKKKREERETADRIQKEKEELEKKKRNNDEKERLAREKAECEEREKLERERKEQEEKERLEKEKRELEERLETESREEEHQARLQREERERLEKEKETKEKPIKEQQENKSKVSIGGRRATKISTVAVCSTEQDSAVLAEDDVPARRTRSRSNSSNSISSERSVSSVNTQQGHGRGRGRGARRTSEPPKTAVVRRGNRRRTVAAETTEQDNNDGVLSRSNSSNSLNSDISSYSVRSQSRGRGGRQRGRSRITEAEPDSIPPINSQSDRNSATKPAARGRKGRKTEPSSSAVPQEDDAENADSQQAPTTRGQRRATTNISESTAADEEKQSNQDEGHGSEESCPPKRNVLGRAQKSGASAAGNGVEGKDKRQGRKRELEPNIEEESHSSTSISIVKVQAVETTQEGGKDESKDENPVQAKRRGRASNAQVKKDTNASPVEVELKIEKENVEKKGRSRPSAVQKKREEEQEESGTSANSTTREAKVQTPEPQTPTSRVSRKRQAPAQSSPVAKTPRSSSSSSPAARGRLQAASPAYKVLFTGVTDEAWERGLARLGGSMAKGVADMDCLVTDQVRRTIKFLCAVAKGIPIVTTCWLEKSGKAGSFLSPHAFVVKDPEQEKKFGFCLQTSLTIARSHLLLQGYEIHVTKSVKPEPAQMKDIISCSGATFLPKMPSSPKPRTVVISCEEDWSLCGPAVSSSLPVVTAEFILSGILQQKSWITADIWAKNTTCDRTHRDTNTSARMGTVSVITLSLLLTTVLSAPVKVDEDSMTLFHGEDFHIMLTSLELEVTFRNRSAPRSPDVVLMRDGAVVNSRAKLNRQLSHLIVDAVGEEDEGVYTVKNPEKPEEIRRITLVVRDCSNEQLITYGDNFLIPLLEVTPFLTLEYRPLAVEANQTSRPALVLLTSTGISRDGYQGRISVNERSISLSAVTGADEGSYTVRYAEGAILKKVCLNVRERQEFLNVPIGKRLKINLVLNSSLVRLYYTPDYDSTLRLLLDKGEFTI